MGMKRILAGLLLLTLAAPASGQDFEEGRDAYMRGDYATALLEFKPLAEQGDAEAQNNLGLMYSTGKGVPQDYANAMKWYRKAAEQGHTEAIWHVGNAYYWGFGRPIDYREALKWWRRGAEKGYSPSQRDLGHMYEKGRGVLQDYAEAVKWYRKAANQGDAAAQHSLGLMYSELRGVPRDYVQAHMWFNLAAYRFFWPGENRDRPERARDALSKRMTPAQIAEAQRLAREWWRKAAEQGLAHAQVRVGMMYDKGEGVPQDYVEAHKWFNLAAAIGQTKGAIELRDKVAKRMTPAQIAEAQRLAREWMAAFKKRKKK